MIIKKYIKLNIKNNNIKNFKKKLINDIYNINFNNNIKINIIFIISNINYIYNIEYFILKIKNKFKNKNLSFILKC